MSDASQMFTCGPYSPARDQRGRDRRGGGGGSVDFASPGLKCPGDAAQRRRGKADDERSRGVGGLNCSSIPEGIGADLDLDISSHLHHLRDRGQQTTMNSHCRFT
ncbi:hypothetical protein F2P81_022463 [Scophthalmus maximus]|uniref:Uncharacterized protein n=1 Tax=Scophthalmus maximus TaxID=52904 RepID=A0A6A4S2M7_SCOMX|nr:hypothetical protein F2P81_022463 [Scophthalmus maximus]